MPVGTYINNNLVQGERLLYTTSLSWLVFVKPILFIIVVGIILAIVHLFWITILFALLLLIPTWLHYNFSEFAVTNKRVILKIGWLTRTAFEINLTHMESFMVEQGLFGRMFNYGAVRVTGTGGSKERFPMIANPMPFRKAALEAMG
jgi:uncharacterized membrane protein YdbT with pleckstrin-like domain